MKNILLPLFIIFSFSAFSQNFEWVKSSGGISSDFGNSIAVDANGNTYITGNFLGTGDYDPGPGVLNFTSNGWEDVFIQKLDTNGNLIWAKTFGGPFYERAYGISIDPSGFIYISGSFGTGTVDFDPGPGVHNVTAITSEMFIEKLDTAGNFIWVKTIPAAGSESIVTVDNSKNLYITGGFSGTVDFDPDTGITNLTSNGFSDIFIQKLDSSGNLLWVKSEGGGNEDESYCITTDAQSNVYIAGFYSGTVDFDPDTGTFYLPFGPYEIFVQKLDSSGNLIWAKGMGGIGSDRAKSISTDPFGNTYITGYFADTADFDPGAGISNLVSNGDKDIFLQKLDANGNMLWVKGYGGTSFDEGFSVTTDASGNAYVTGRFDSSADFDPGPGTVNLTPLGWGWDMFIQKFDQFGNLIWVYSFGGTANTSGYSITSNAFNELMLTGFYQDTVDFNPGVGVNNLISTGNQDVFVLKLSQDLCSNLSLQFDSVSNLTCIDSAYTFAHAIYGLPPYNYSWNTVPPIFDSTAVFSSSGIYTLSVTDGNNCTKSSSALISGPSTMAGFDLKANLISTNFRSGFESIIWLDALNSGCIDTSGQLSLIIDNLVTYDSSSIVPDQINGDTLIWNFNSLSYDSIHLMPQVFLTTSTSAVIGDTICFDLIITPVIGDVDSSNNIKRYCFPNLNGYDPNDKQVYPSGQCSEKYVLNNERLTYTLRFQNTGNADAINIYLLDSISPFLDINTVSVISQSHSMYTEVLAGNVLKFNFDSIQLPDSTSNQVGSHGFVIFKINPLPSLPNGTIISNKGEIYFDFNPPVVTNTVSNTVIDIVPSCFVGIEFLSTNEEELLIYPNPTSHQLTIVSDQFKINEINLINLTGKKIKSIKQNTDIINVADLPSGIYFIKVITDERIITKKFVKQ